MRHTGLLKNDELHDVSLAKRRFSSCSQPRGVNYRRPDALTEKQIADLASSFSPAKLKTTALRFLGLKQRHLHDLDSASRENQEEMKREILRTWAWRNRKCQVQVRVVLGAANRSVPVRLFSKCILFKIALLTL